MSLAARHTLEDFIALEEDGSMPLTHRSEWVEIPGGGQLRTFVRGGMSHEQNRSMGRAIRAMIGKIEEGNENTKAALEGIERKKEDLTSRDVTEKSDG